MSRVFLSLIFRNQFEKKITPHIALIRFKIKIKNVLFSIHINVFYVTFTTNSSKNAHKIFVMLVLFEFL